MATSLMDVLDGRGPSMAHHLLACVRSGPGNIKAVRFALNEFGKIEAHRLLWEHADATQAILRRHLKRFPG